MNTIKVGDTIKMHIDWCDSQEDADVEYKVLELRSPNDEFPDFVCESKDKPFTLIDHCMIFPLPED